MIPLTAPKLHQDFHSTRPLEDLLREQRRRGVPTTKRTAVYVYQAPLRAWHWVNALSITVLAITGWFIANPLPSMPGEASDHFVMGYFRFFHFAAAYVFAVGFLFRIYWAFVGNKYSHQLFTLPFWRRSFWHELWHEVRWYAFLETGAEEILRP